MSTEWINTAVRESYICASLPNSSTSFRAVVKADSWAAVKAATANTSKAFTRRVFAPVSWKILKSLSALGLVISKMLWRSSTDSRGRSKDSSYARVAAYVRRHGRNGQIVRHILPISTLS